MFNLYKAISYILAIPVFLACIVLFVFVFAWVLILWVFGAPIKIKEQDRMIGYVRWFKFYPK